MGKKVSGKRNKNKGSKYYREKHEKIVQATPKIQTIEANWTKKILCEVERQHKQKEKWRKVVCMHMTTYGNWPSMRNRSNNSTYKKIVNLRRLLEDNKNLENREFYPQNTRWRSAHKFMPFRRKKVDENKSADKWLKCNQKSNRRAERGGRGRENAAGLFCLQASLSPTTGLFASAASCFTAPYSYSSYWEWRERTTEGVLSTTNRKNLSNVMIFFSHFMYVHFNGIRDLQAEASRKMVFLRFVVFVKLVRCFTISISESIVLHLLFHFCSLFFCIRETFHFNIISNSWKWQNQCYWHRTEWKYRFFLLFFLLFFFCFP